MKALALLAQASGQLLLAFVILFNGAGPALAQSDAAQLETNKATVRRVINEVQRDGNFAAFEQLFARDYVDHTPFPGYESDREGTRQIYLALRTAFPDFRATIHRQIAEGEFVTTFKTYHGTHRGAFMGTSPTGRAIRFQAMDIMRVRNGEIADHWGITDADALTRQLSVPPPTNE